MLTPFIGGCGQGKSEAPKSDYRVSKASLLDTALAKSPQWLDYYDPSRSEGGYNLILYARRRPALIDMNGVVVHTWPDVRAVGRARLLRNGHLALINDRGRFEEYDWQGRRTWTFRPHRATHFLHHDFARLQNGNYLLLVRRPGKGTDYLLEVDRSGAEIWKWESSKSIQEDLPRAREFAATSDKVLVKHDKTHINSVQELPPNPWFERGHKEFKPGNILVSARNLNALYVIARPEGNVVWKYYEGLDYQHEARMIPGGHPGGGNIILFNNHYHSLERYRQSALVELNPVKRSVVWRYRSPNFFSSTGGTQQVLRDGNVLVTSTQGGRVFELTRKGRIVWQWAPPYLPMRVSRYPYDFCPQLAALGRPSERPVRRQEPERFLDADLYSFALPDDMKQVGNAVLLRQSDGCRRLRLPERAELKVGYGIVHPGQCGPTGERPVRFGVSIRRLEAGPSRTLMERTVTASAFGAERDVGPVLLRRETLSLSQYGRQTVELCLTLASFSGAPPPRCFRWAAPRISRTRSLLTPSPDEEDLAVQKYQREQLKALGYTN